MEKLLEIEKAALKTLAELEKESEEASNTPQETIKRKHHRRRTFHGSTHQLKAPKESQSSRILEHKGILTQSPGNKSHSVRKPLQVVSAMKASSNYTPFTTCPRKVKNKSSTRQMFPTKTMETVIKSKNPLLFTTPKSMGNSSSNLSHKKTNKNTGGSTDLTCQSSETSMSSGDDFTSNIQTLLTSRKSKKLDFIVKDSKSSKTRGNTWKTVSSISSSTVTKSSSLSLFTISKSSSSAVTTTSASSSTITSDLTPPGKNINEKKAQNNADSSIINSKINEDTNCKLDFCIKSSCQKVSKVEENMSEEEDEFSKSFGSRSLDINVHSSPHKVKDVSCSKHERNTNDEKLVISERKELKVSRRSGKSSRKALQEARLKRWKNKVKNDNQDTEMGCTLNSTRSPTNFGNCLKQKSVPSTPIVTTHHMPPPTHETEVICTQKFTRSPTNFENPCMSSGTDAQSSLSSLSSTNSSQGLESSKKPHKNWMHLFEEPFPRRSPRLSSLPAGDTKEYEHLLDNFSPLTSRERSRKKRLKGCQKKRTTKNTVSKDSEIVNIPVSPLVTAEKETSPSVLQTSMPNFTPENDVDMKEESLKRPLKRNPDKTFISKKKKESPSSNIKENSSPCSTSIGLSDEVELHFPKPSADLTCQGGPYSMVVDFSLPDKDFAKLKLAKIKENQAKKTASKDPNRQSKPFCDPKERKKQGCDIEDNENKNREVKKDDDSESTTDDAFIIPIVNKSIANKDEEVFSATSTRKVLSRSENEVGKKDAVNSKVEDDMNQTLAAPKAEIEQCITHHNNKDALSEENSTQYSDSENTPSGSILQPLQEIITVEDSKCVKIQALNDKNLSINKLVLESGNRFGGGNVGNSSCLSDLANECQIGTSSLSKRCSSNMLKMSPCLAVSSKNYSPSIYPQHHDSLVRSSQSQENCETLESHIYSGNNGMKGNENKRKHERVLPGKEFIPSSQGSTTSQSPNVLKGLLSLNKKNVNDSAKTLAVLKSCQEIQQQHDGSQRVLGSSESTIVSEEVLQGVASVRSKKEVGETKCSEIQPCLGQVQSQQHDSDIILESVETTEVNSGNMLSLDKENTLSHVNQLNGDQSKNSQLLLLEIKSDTKMVSSVNQVPDDQSIPIETSSTLLHGETEVVSGVSQIPDDQPIPIETSSNLFHGDMKMVSSVNQVPDNQPSPIKTSSTLLHAGTEMVSGVNQVPSNQLSLKDMSSMLHGDTELKHAVNQEELSSQCDGSLPFSSNTEEFNDDTPSIKDSLPLYSNTEHTPCHGGSFPLCSNTEEFNNNEGPLCPNAEELSCVESESLEPSVGDTATPYGKASIPNRLSVTAMCSDQKEGSVLTPVLMQACLQHETDDSNKVQSISMWTYDIPGHVLKKRDVIAVCLSHWVVLWIKVPGQEWTVLKSWMLDQIDSEVFNMVEFLPVSSHLVLFVGGTFHAANGRIYGYSETTSYDFQLEHQNIDDMVSFNAMCVLNDKQQSASPPDNDVEIVVAGTTANRPILTKWSLDCLCLDIKEKQAFTLSDTTNTITSLCTVFGSSCLLVGSAGNYIFLWNFKSCRLLKEISLSNPRLCNSDCLQATTEMGLLFLTMCQRPSQKDKFGINEASCLLCALNPVNNKFKCLKSFPLNNLSTRCCVSGQYLAIGQDGVACLLNMAAPHNWVSFPVFQGPIQSTGFHPNRPVIAFGSSKNGCVHLYSLS